MCIGKFSLRIFACCIEALQLHAAIICHYQFTTHSLVLGLNAKSHYIIEHNVSIIQLGFGWKHSNYISRNCQKALKPKT